MFKAHWLLYHSMLGSRVKKKKKKKADPKCTRSRDPRRCSVSRGARASLFWYTPEEGRYQATWERMFKLPWRKTGPLKSSR